MKNALLALALLAGTATAAGAQPKSRASRSQKNRATAPAQPAPAARKKPVLYDFTGDEIDGDRIRPDGTTIFGLRSARHGSLIRLRGDFVREIVKSAERL